MALGRHPGGGPQAALGMRPSLTSGVPCWRLAQEEGGFVVLLLCWIVICDFEIIDLLLDCYYYFENMLFNYSN